MLYKFVRSGVGLIHCASSPCSGVPAIVDFAAMRDAVKRLGGDPDQINPVCPADLVIDHSVQVDMARRLVPHPRTHCPLVRTTLHTISLSSDLHCCIVYKVDRLCNYTCWSPVVLQELMEFVCFSRVVFSLIFYLLDDVKPNNMHLVNFQLT